MRRDLSATETPVSASMSTPDRGRRRLLGAGAALALGAALPLPSLASRIPLEPARALKLASIHTGERLSVTYWEHGAYLPDALEAVAWQLRDHRTDDVHPIDPRLLDILAVLRHELDLDEDYQVISGYRSPRTNAALAARSRGVAKNSLHMRGMAIDVRVRGRRLGDLRQRAVALRAGGVGFYRRSRFVHLDLGRPRTW